MLIRESEMMMSSQFSASGFRPSYVHGQDYSGDSTAIIALYEYGLETLGCYLCRSIFVQEPQDGRCVVCHAQFVFLSAHYCFACGYYTKTHHCINCGVNQLSEGETKILTLCLRAMRVFFKLETRSGLMAVADMTTFFPAIGKLAEIFTLLTRGSDEHWISQYEAEGVLPWFPVTEPWCQVLLEMYQRKEPDACCPKE